MVWRWFFDLWLIINHWRCLFWNNFEITGLVTVLECIGTHISCVVPICKSDEKTFCAIYFRQSTVEECFENQSLGRHSFWRYAQDVFIACNFGSKRIAALTGLYAPRGNVNYFSVGSRIVDIFAAFWSGRRVLWSVFRFPKPTPKFRFCAAGGNHWIFHRIYYLWKTLYRVVCWKFCAAVG